MQFKKTSLGLSLAYLLGSAAVGHAETFVLDGSTGANYDAVGDGWFFGPLDGVGDLDGNALAVGYIAGTLELRALAEFPLAPLGTLTATQVQSATLQFTIDDVLSTFGPGANFDGTASDPIAVYHYPADGTVAVADFNPPGLTQLGIVGIGAITDASLAVSGAVSFTVDATQALKDALTGGDAAFGALFGTLDSPTAASLDNLSPPGVTGGALPKLTITTIPLVPPVLSKAARSCQTTLAKEGAKLVATTLKAFSGCFDLVLKDYADDSTITATTVTKCAGAVDTSNPASTIGKATDKFLTKAPAKCTGLVPADLNSPCDGAATTFAQTATCLALAHRAAAETIVANGYATSCTLLNAVGLDAVHPGICLP